jgi:hypothetical protein
MVKEKINEIKRIKIEISKKKKERESSFRKKKIEK